MSASATATSKKDVTGSDGKEAMAFVRRLVDEGKTADEVITLLREAFTGLTDTVFRGSFDVLLAQAASDQDIVGDMRRQATYTRIRHQVGNHR